MTRYRIFAIVLLLCVYRTGFAQPGKAIVTGTVKDKEGVRIAGVTVSLVDAVDSLVLVSTASDSLGFFRFGLIPSGSYSLKITGVGYSTYWSGILGLTSTDSIVLNPVLAKNGVKGLEQVVVRGGRPLFEQKSDRTVMNVAAIVSNSGSNALDLLEKMPGVTVDKDGNVSLKGRQNVLIVVDGKPTYLSGSALANLLRSMNADGISRVEVMTNPGARYDASGSAGVINFVTKKGSKGGFNGDVSLGYGQGRYWKTFNSLNLNYRKGKVNLYLNGGVNADRTFFDISDHQQIYATDNVTVSNYLDQQTHFNDHNAHESLRTGLDYDLSSRTTVGLSLSGFISPATSDYSTTAILSNGSYHTDSFLVTTDHSAIHWDNRVINPYFIHRFDSLSELSGDASYIRYASRSNQDIENSDTDSTHTISTSSPLRIHIPFTINIYTGRLDYGRIVKGIGKFEAGFKMSHTQTQSAADYFSLGVSGQMQFDANRSNQFVYREAIEAEYANLSGKSGRWDYQAGLRYEQTNAHGKRFGNALVPDSAFSIRYATLFPSLSLGFKVSDKHQLGFSASRRIDRPAYNDLNPFINYVSRYVSDQGNPFLQAQTGYSLELSHRYKELLFTTINFSHTDNQFVPLFRTQDNITIATPSNLGHAQTIGISSTLQLNILPWWMFSFTAFGAYNSQSGIANGAPVSYNFYKANLNTVTQLRMGHGWVTELSGVYNTRNQFGQFVVHGMGNFSMALSKSLLKEKGSLKVNFRDVFYTRVFNADVNIGGVQGYQKVFEHVIRKSDTRRVNISFTYRFGKSAGARRSKPDSSSEEEQKRVNH